MTAFEELLKDVEQMKKNGESEDKIQKYIDETIRLANAVTMAVL